jgi:DNA end-binding protein Ku
MAARAVGSVTVSFGLVSIPVKLYSATDASSGFHFNMLHGKCGSRLKQQYICPRDNEIVPRSDMVKGYEFAKDKYVTFSEEELKALEEKATQAIDIVEFIPIEKIDPIYFDKPYYLGPDKGGAKAYSLLAETMRRTGRVALGRYAARGKQYLILLRVVEDGILMHQLLYADEVRPFSEVPLENVEVREQELKLAIQLVDQISSDSFRPEAYEDDVRKRVQEAVDKKVAGQEVSLAPAEPVGAQIIDLMEALKASLSGAKPAAAPVAEAPPAAQPSEDHSIDAKKPPRRASRRSDEEKVKAGGKK